MTIHDLPSPCVAAEDSAVRALRDAGFDAFVCSSDSSLKGGVSVRVSERDSRFEWTTNRAEPAPVGHNYSTYGGAVVIHAGRLTCEDELQRLQDFVDDLAARATMAVAA